MDIYFLRHGETDWNKEGRVQGHTDIMLNLNGRKQIGQSAEVLADLPFDFELIIASPLWRARESAEIVAARLESAKENIVEEPLLIERNFGEAEGMKVTELVEKYSVVLSRFPLYQYPGSESLEEILERGRSVFEKIVDSYGNKSNILVVAHGAILSAIITAITNGKVAYFGEKSHFDPASLYLIKYQNGEIGLARYCANESAVVDITY